MNKTVNMNLGGFFFHIDEDAYQKLNRYFDAIKKSLSSDGRDEIMNDIENRISELFSERLTKDKQVLSVKDVDDIIVVMGQPEDYKIEEDEPKKTTYTYIPSGSKKLYRDTENGILGGVASGLGHYFGIDKVWIRVALVLLIFAGFGTGILAYIILWVVSPEARTTAEKLEMRGEPITISNIEKKVKQEFENVSEKFKSATGKFNDVDYSKFNNQMKSSAEKINGSLEGIFGSIFKVVGKLVGIFVVCIASAALIGLIISAFTLGSTSFIHAPWMDYFKTFNYTGNSLFTISLAFLLAVGIPFFALLYLGLKILVTNLRSMGTAAKYSLISLWIMAILTLVFLISRQVSEIAFENKVVEKKTLNINPSDTLHIKFKTNDYYSKNFDEHEDFKLVQDSVDNDLIYSNDINFEIVNSETTYPYIIIEKTANGNSLKDAKNRAEKIDYGFKFENNRLILENYLLTDAKNKFRDQEIEIYLYLPKGIIFKADKSLQEYDRSDNDYFNLHFSSDDYVYKVGSDKIKCLNCPPDEDEYDDQEDEDDNENATSLIINGNGLKIKNDTTITDAKNIKELKINKNGVIIKTN
jgi:phage shock protein PspC (stress-responsive transcriptional regulator)